MLKWYKMFLAQKVDSPKEIKIKAMEKNYLSIVRKIRNNRIKKNKYVAHHPV